MGCRICPGDASAAACFFPPVPPVLRPVFFRGLFLRCFNDLSCIWRALTPCKSPVFFTTDFFSPTPCPAIAPAHCLSIVFFIVFHCSCASGFSEACARPCIVTGAHFPL